MREPLRGGSKCLGFVVWTVGWTGWSRGQEGELGSRVRLLGARAFERGGPVLGVRGLDSGVDRVVSGPKEPIGEWAQAPLCEGVERGGASAWGSRSGQWGG